MVEQTPRARTRIEIMKLLCAEPRTAKDLASRLGISATAVRKVLQALQEEKLVTFEVYRGGVGKPAHRFAITADGEQFLSTAYLPFANALLAVLSREMGTAAVERLLKHTGEQMAPPLLRAGEPLDVRLPQAVAILNSLGAVAAVKTADGKMRVECECCAIAGIVAEHPNACGVMEALLAQLTGASVTEQCDREPRPRCRMLVQPS